MILSASYLNGFAPRDGQPLYPSLWKGCVGAWNPGLGPSGLVLRDQSGFSRHGTLTNGPTFAADQGRYAMNFDGTDDYVDVGSGIDTNNITRMTLSAWVRNNVVAANKGIVGWWNGSNGIFIQSQIVGTDGFLFVSSGTSYGHVDFTTINTWTHVVQVYDGTLTGDGNRLRAFINGIQRTIVFDASSVPSSTSSTGNGIIGNVRTLSRYWNGFIDDVRIYNRALSPNEIRTLANRRGIAYEMAPRRRSSVQVTTNRRRRIIIGGNR